MIITTCERGGIYIQLTDSIIKKGVLIGEGYSRRAYLIKNRVYKIPFSLIGKKEAKKGDMPHIVKR